LPFYRYRGVIKEAFDFNVVLSDLFQLLRGNYILESITIPILQKVFNFVDSQLFNSFIKRKDLFTCGGGCQLKMAISLLESNLTKVDNQLNKIIDFSRIKEAATLLVMDKSMIVSDATFAQEVFPHLNNRQISHILERFKPDQLAPEPIPEVVKKKITALGLLSSANVKLPLAVDPAEIPRINLVSQL